MSIEDLLKLHRRISACFASRPHKIPRIPFLDRTHAPFQSLEFTSRGQPGQLQVWDVHGEPPAVAGQRAPRQLLHREHSAERLCAWLHANGLAGPQTQLTAQRLAAPVALADLQALQAALQQGFPPEATFAPPMERLLAAEEVTACLVVGNFHLPREERSVRQAALVYATSWGELFCRPQAREVALLEHAPRACLLANCHAPLAETMTFLFHKPPRSQCRDVYWI